MSNYINEALLDASPYRKQKDEAGKLVSKWEKTGLLEGLNEDFNKSGMAVLLENQARQLINEFNTTSPSGTGTSNQEEWSGVALPLVRRIFSSIAAQDFVSVQPMNLPSGLVFYLDFKYGTTQNGFTKGKSVFGDTGPLTTSGSTAPYGVGGFYGDNDKNGNIPGYDYTISQSAVIPTASNWSWESIAVADHTVSGAIAFDFDAELSASVLAAKAVDTWFKVHIPIGDLPNADFKAIRSFHIGGSGSAAGLTDGTAVSASIPQLTKLSADGGYVSFVINADSEADVEQDSGLQVVYSKQPTAENRGDFEDRLGHSDDGIDLSIPQVDLQLNSLSIVAKTRKLKAVWTPELAQDLNAYHSVDAEAELTSMLSEYISMEIDLEILDMLVTDAVTTDYWSARPGNDFNSATNTFENTTFTGTRFEWWQTLVGKVQKISNEIHRLTLRGGANFVVCGPKIATILESLPGFMADTDGNQMNFAMGVQKVGGLQSRFNVYKNPYMAENTMLVGFRGGNFLETGAVYAPYVPLIMTPLVYDPEDFTPRKGVMTRYAKKMVRPEFYAKIHCTDLNLI